MELQNNLELVAECRAVRIDREKNDGISKFLVFCEVCTCQKKNILSPTATERSSSSPFQELEQKHSSELTVSKPLACSCCLFLELVTRTPCSYILHEGKKKENPLEQCGWVAIVGSFTSGLSL